MTGLCLPFLEAHLEEFWRERKDDPVLRRMDVQDYIDPKGINLAQVKLLVIRGKGKLYGNRLLKIKVVFSDHYPRIPPKMYF